MITYVDTSTLLKRLLDEVGSARADVIWESADVLASVAMVVVEARAALAAAERRGRLTVREHRAAKAGLADLLDEVAIAGITEELVATAADLAEEEALRGYDAVHLAAALAVGAQVLTSSDSALCAAAERRGLHVANPLDG
ncbi:MAG: PIN domain-containing protein [Microthrixaceae bacterium]|nr:PIN domain-containing protein [Microthrixaceae bacterium]